MTSQPTPGTRFSDAYLERGKPAADSARMRHRLASLLLNTPDLEAIGPVVGRELGVRVPVSPWGYDWPGFFAECELRDVLDFVTVAWRYLHGKLRTGIRDTRAPAKWVAEVQRIFVEENVSYRVDGSGGVHLFVDEEFEHNRVATLKVLGAPRYANVLAEFESAHAALSRVPPDGKGAVRSTFTAAEGLFRLMFSKAPRLGAKEVRAHLGPTLQRIHANDGTAAAAATKLLAGFGEWVDAAHFYRHEAGKEEVAQPPLTLAIQLVSLGASYIRWLAEVDASGA
jgi:hypothetical protein